MSTTINVFPNTDIIVNGDVPYTFTSNDTGHLNHVELKPKVSSESINVDLSGISFESVAIEDGTDLGENTLQWVTTSMSNQTWSRVQNRTLTCDDSIKDTYIDELRFLVTKGYNVSGVTVPLIIGDVPDIMYDYTTKALSATVDTGQSYDLSWSISVTQEATYNPYNIPISDIIEIVKTDATHAELRFKNTNRFPWLFGIITVTLTDSVSGFSTDVEIDCAVRWSPEIRGTQTIDDFSRDYVYEIWMENLYTGTYVQLTTHLMDWSIREDLTDPYLIGKMTMYNSSRLWGTLRPNQSSLTTEGEYQIVINAKCPSPAYMFYPYDQDFSITVDVQRITGLSITTYPQQPTTEYGEFGYAASVTGPQGAVYDLQWSVSYSPSGGGSAPSQPTITKTGDLSATLVFRYNYVAFMEGGYYVIVTDAVSGLSASIPFSYSIWPYAYISGPSNIDASGTYQFRGYACIDDNVLGPLRDDLTGHSWVSPVEGTVHDTIFTLQNAPSGVTIDQYNGVLTVPDNIDSTFTVNVSVVTAVQDSGLTVAIFRDDASMPVTVYTVVQQVRTVTYDLNNNWMVSTYSHPSDSMGMAMFQSESNYHVSGTTATMYIRYSASNTPDEVAVFICSNSEPGYDYTKIYALDSESTVATDTSSHQGTPSGLLSTNYVQQSYTIPGDNQTHFIRIDYYKDSSGNQREDRGFVCVAPIDGQVINPYTPQAPVASVDISEVVYMGNGTYEFDVEVSPVNADTSALRFDPWYTCNFVSSSMDLGQTWTDTGFGTIKTKGHVYFTGLVSNSGQFGIVLKSDNDPGIFDEEVVTVGDI